MPQPLSKSKTRSKLRAMEICVALNAMVSDGVRSAFVKPAMVMRSVLPLRCYFGHSPWPPLKTPPLAAQLEQNAWNPA